MSYETFNTSADPSTPASGKATLFVATTDRYLTLKDANGVLSRVSDNELYNWLINGGFWFAQRQAPASATTYSATADRALSADCWGITNENASATYQRTDTSGSPETGLQGRFYGNFLKTTSTGKLIVTQPIEGNDTRAIAGRTVRVQCWMKQLVGATPTVRLGLAQLTSAGTIDTLPATYISAFGANGTDPTLGTNVSYIAPKSASGLVGDNCTINGNAFDCVLSASWQRFGGVFDVPSTCKNLIVSIWGTNQFAATNGFAISQVSLTDGYELQEWSPFSIEQEFNRALRHYCKTFNMDTNPAASAGALTGEIRIPAPVTASTAWPANWTWEFPVPMWKAPGTLTLFNPAAAGAQVRNQTLNTDCTASAVSANGEKRCLIAGTTPASTVVGTNILGVHVTAEAKL